MQITKAICSKTTWKWRQTWKQTKWPRKSGRRQLQLNLLICLLTSISNKNMNNIRKRCMQIWNHKCLMMWFYLHMTLIWLLLGLRVSKANIILKIPKVTQQTTKIITNNSNNCCKRVITNSMKTKNSNSLIKKLNGSMKKLKYCQKAIVLLRSIILMNRSSNQSYFLPMYHHT